MRRKYYFALYLGVSYRCSIEETACILHTLDNPALSGCCMQLVLLQKSRPRCDLVALFGKSHADIASPSVISGSRFDTTPVLWAVGCMQAWCCPWFSSRVGPDMVLSLCAGGCRQPRCCALGPRNRGVCDGPHHGGIEPHLCCDPHSDPNGSLPQLVRYTL
jgi:hypothetical protein